MADQFRSDKRPTLRGPTQGRSCQTGLLGPRVPKPSARAAAPSPLDTPAAGDHLTFLKCM